MDNKMENEMETTIVYTGFRFLGFRVYIGFGFRVLGSWVLGF